MVMVREHSRWFFKEKQNKDSQFETGNKQWFSVFKLNVLLTHQSTLTFSLHHLSQHSHLTSSFAPVAITAVCTRGLKCVRRFVAILISMLCWGLIVKKCWWIVFFVFLSKLRLAAIWICLITGSSYQLELFWNHGSGPEITEYCNRVKPLCRITKETACLIYTQVFSRVFE